MLDWLRKQNNAPNIDYEILSSIFRIILWDFIFWYDETNILVIFTKNHLIVK